MSNEQEQRSGWWENALGEGERPTFNEMMRAQELKRTEKKFAGFLEGILSKAKSSDFRQFTFRE